MEFDFISRKLTAQQIRINGKIKKAITAYRDKRVPMSVLLTNFLAVKSKGDALAQAENPWAYFYKGIEGHEIESGVSVDETLFRFATMEIKDQRPTDVINAAFFANKKRNDSAFELGYLLPLFLDNVKSEDSILVVNPSPDIICTLETRHIGRRCYAVTDQTVAGLYRSQFPEAEFVSLQQMTLIHNMDAVLITARDQSAENSKLFFDCLKACNDQSIIFSFIPSVWFDNPKNGTYRMIREEGFFVEKVLVISPEVTISSPRKKLLALLRKGEESNLPIYQSIYDNQTKEFQVLRNPITIDANKYFRSNYTIISSIKNASLVDEVKTEPKYNRAREYHFSVEITLFYKVYAGRKNRFAGVTYYKQIKDPDLKTFGKKATADIEKGLRADSEDKIIAAMEEIPFDEKVYPIIRSDIERCYLGIGRPVTFKTIWFYCWNQLASSPKYEHALISKAMRSKNLADCFPQNTTGSSLLNLIAESYNVGVEDLTYRIVEQFNLIIEAGIKNSLVPFNPLELYLKEYSNRATERQQDVRNALVKKHFSHVEEMRLFKALIEDAYVNAGCCRRCVVESVILASAIRLFTGIAIREVAALTWADFTHIPETDSFQLIISKIVDKKGKALSHSEKKLWKRYRVVPVASTLAILLLQRKRFLIDNGIDKDYLERCPVILAEERLSEMKQKKTMKYCKPSVISQSSRELLSKINMPQINVILPDDSNDLTTDFGRYHGDIFLSNFRHKANHVAFLTNGEINYITAVEAPDTFSKYYCDFMNDFIQLGIVEKLKRWDYVYERIVKEESLSQPTRGKEKGAFRRTSGPYTNGLTAIDLVVENKTDREVELSAEGQHGIEINITEY